jgi:hypothetical protein
MIQDKIEALAKMEQEIQKLQMEVTAKTGAFNEEIVALFRELGLPEQFSILQAIDATNKYRSGLILNV